jgi:uncharacterized protein (DUF2342 family)
MKPRARVSASQTAGTLRRARLSQWILGGSGEVSLDDGPRVDPTARAELEALAAVGLTTATSLLRMALPQRSGPSVRVVSQRGWVEHISPIVASLLDAALPPLQPGDSETAAATQGLEQSVVDLIDRTPGGQEEVFARLTGLLLGNLALTASGSHDMPLPYTDSTLLIVGGNLDGYAIEWDLPPQVVRAWICQHQATLTAIYSQQAVRERLTQLEVTYLTPIDTGSEHFSIEAFVSRERGRTVIDADSLFDSIQGDRERSATEELDALASLANACSWYVARRSGDIELERLVDRLIEITIRRQSEPSLWDRAVETWFGVPIGPVARPDALALVEVIADVAGLDSLSGLWASEKRLPTARALSDPAGWLVTTGVAPSLAASVALEWQRRLGAYPTRDPRGGRPAVPGQRPTLAHRGVLTWPEQVLDIPALRQYAQAMIDHPVPDADERIAEKMRGEIQGLSTMGHVVLRRPIGSVSPDYFLGTLTGHLHATLVRRRGPIDQPLRHLATAYTALIGARDDVQQALVTPTGNALVQVHDFVMRIIGHKWPDELADLSAEDEGLFFGWLLDQAGVAASPELLAWYERDRSRRIAAPPA